MTLAAELLRDEFVAGLDILAEVEAEEQETFRQFVARVNPQYQWAKHSEILGSVIERITAGVLRRVIVLMPPRRSKSETVTRLGAAYYLRRHPTHYVGIASYGAEIAHALSRDVRRYWLTSHGRGASLEDAARARHAWETGLGGGCWGSGAGGPMAGRGWHWGIIDDPHKGYGEAVSPAEQRSIHDWYEGVWTARAAPGAAICIVTNRWAVDDLVGWILEKERQGETREHWHLVVFDEEHQAGEYVVPEGCTVERDWRSPGEVLWPERYPDLEATKAEAGRHWVARSQQRPVRDVIGALWRSSMIQHVPAIPFGVRLVKSAVGLDPAAKHGMDSDETGIVGASLGEDGIVYITHDDSDRLPPEVWARRADIVAEAIGAREILPEDNNGGEMIKATFRAAGVKRDVHLVTSTESKMVRAEPVAALYAEGKVKHVGMFPALEQEMCSYTGIGKGKSPNRLDALVIALTQGFPGLFVEKPVLPFQGRLTFGR